MKKKNNNVLILLIYLIISTGGYFVLRMTLDKYDKTLPLPVTVLIVLLWFGTIIGYMIYNYKKKNKDKTISSTQAIAFTALAAALICVTTIIYIPVPGGIGYIHIGDSLIFLFSYLLPLPFAVIAAGIGSATADIITGYSIYAVPTLLIKSCMAVIARSFIINNAKTINLLAGFIIGSLFMQVGYLLVEILLFGEAVGVTVFLFGLIQSIASVPLALLLIKAVRKVPDIERIRNQWEGM